MYTISRLAGKFNLSRSTLLYYESIGLLDSSARTPGNYRLYSQAAARRLEKICLYRSAGLKLQDIKKVLEAKEHQIHRALEGRLLELNQEIMRLREQQRVIIALLKNPPDLSKVGVMNKKTWSNILAASGFSEADMRNWHVEFERRDPEKHQEFLEFLCIPPQEIAKIRSWSEIKGQRKKTPA
ncbi:MAG: MerR family transcriptional regulator [Desulfarculaceae bacterium]|jgi:DNA-binding transcriptional MerR regulator